jgi:hypothetical protein
MKNWIWTIALILGINGVLFAAPKILVPETSWDFGHVPQNSVLTHDYWIKNIGTDTLKIIKVKPG